MTSAYELFAIDRLLSDEEKAVAATVQQWGAQFAVPRVADWFETAAPPVRELAVELGRLGLLGMHLQGYGCAGSTAVQYGMACLELEAIDSGLRSLVSVQGSLAMFALWRYGSEEQKSEWLPEMVSGRAIGCFGLTEADFGSDPAGMRTTARRDGTDWILNGSKMWITNGSVADLAIIWARTADGIRGFAVPTDAAGFHSREITRKLSLRASITAELIMESVRLPDDALLPGAIGLAGPLRCLTEARFGIVFGALGAARDCLETARRYAQDRQVFGRPLSSTQLTQRKLAQMAVEWGNGMLLALHLGRLKDAGALRPEQVSLGKLNNVEKALQIARECRTILGANGISLDYPVIRHAANLESVLTYEGTSEVHLLTIGQALTGQSAFR
ncbi:acyl-CoA dehydrogenase family protein [Microlunatus panaciterrae]|uniref:Glutaryl-CoA dehydrogenase n=1 Tax=Microlunatus panaciterrae TaxID=400768 RepID=A0ABS2RGK2_9ACTN|nr:acyl-CoA dehydrogenase family protein [Microlunatus panaciterrae]MBM7798126.1 glutaryl-CoA dehydrogenase [Microlunatus panaciterrae]